VDFALIQVYQKIKKKRTPPKSKEFTHFFIQKTKRAKAGSV
jgi:hypothetical protein